MRAIIITLTITLLLLGAAPLAAGECDRLQSATPEAMVAYLSKALPSENAKCVIFAIQSIGAQHEQRGIPVLIKLLDFRRPLDQVEKTGVADRNYDYPAMGALEKIGRTSSSSVLDAIKSDTTTIKARENAVHVWMFFYSDESAKGVALLKREEDLTYDTTVKQHLNWAVSSAMTMCAPNDEEQCKAATQAHGSRLRKIINQVFFK